MTTEEPTADAAAPLDLLLTDAALGPGAGCCARRVHAAFARRAWPAGPADAGRRVGALAGELGRIARGTLDGRPGEAGPPLHRPGLDRRTRCCAGSCRPTWPPGALPRAGRRRRSGLARRRADAFLVDNLVDAPAPTNNPLLQPGRLEGGRSTPAGSAWSAASGTWPRTWPPPPRVPAMVAPDAFEVGADLAVTPGAVVLRTEMFELIQYPPQTAPCPRPAADRPADDQQVLRRRPGARPQPGRVPRRQGQQVFVVSWRNPDARHRDWGLDAYGQAILDALTRPADRRTDRSHLLGTCSGGILAAMVAGAPGRHRRAGPARRVHPGGHGARPGPGRAPRRRSPTSARRGGHRRLGGARGYLDGRALAEVFAWLRPSDLIWNYWVNNYLQGDAAGVRHPVLERRHHPDDRRAAPRLRRLAAGQRADPARRGDDARHPGRPGRDHRDSYVVAGSRRPHLPVAACYRSTQLLGGDSRFVLSTSGHIAVDGQPAGQPKASSRSPRPPRGPDDWLTAAHRAGLLVAGLRRLAGERGGEKAAPAHWARRLWTPRPAATSWTRRRPMHVRPWAWRRLRVDVRPGRPRRRRCCCATASAPSLELLQTVRRRARPGARGDPLRRPGRRRLAAAAAALPRSRCWPGWSPGARPARLRAGSTCSASPGAAGSPSSSPSSTRAAAGGWCWSPPATGALMVPGRPGCCCGWSPRAATATPATPRASPRPLRRTGCASRAPARLVRGNRRAGPRRGYLYQLAAGARLDQPAVPAADPAADAGAGRRRRPDHPAGQRPASWPA